MEKTQHAVVVQTKDAVLVAAKDQVQDVKHIVQQLKAAGRTEHWIVVSGTANVTIDGKDTLLSENQSIYIPLGAVQSSSYHGEDDIVRFADRYGCS